MITKTYTFWWYEMSSIHQKQDNIKQVNKTWTMNTVKELNQYAGYKAKAIGAFKHEEYIR